jgi:hypothetical protein
MTCYLRTQDGGTATQNASAKSREDGTFSLPGLPPEATGTLTLTKPGYLRLDNVDVSSQNHSLGPLLLVYASYPVHGKVLLKGAPAARVQVAGEGGFSFTDAEGNFTLQGYPKTGGAVLATMPGFFARVVARPDQDAVLQLQPQSLQPTDTVRGAAIRQKLSPQAPQQAPKAKFNFREQFAWTIALPLGGERGAQLIWLADTQIALLGTDQTAQAQERIKQILAAMWVPTYKLSVLLNAATRVQDTALGRSYWKQAQAPALGTPPTDTSYQAEESREKNLWQLVLASHRFEGEAAANVALQRAVAFTRTVHTAKMPTRAQRQDDSAEYALASHAADVAQASPQLLQKLLDFLADAPGYEARALCLAIPVVAKTQGLAQARPLLAT